MVWRRGDARHPLPAARARYDADAPSRRLPAARVAYRAHPRRLGQATHTPALPVRSTRRCSMPSSGNACLAWPRLQDAADVIARM